MTPAHLVPLVWLSLGWSLVPCCPRSALLGSTELVPTDCHLSFRCAPGLLGGSDHRKQHEGREAGAEPHSLLRALLLVFPVLPGSSLWPQLSLPPWTHVPVPVGRPHLSWSSRGLCFKIPAPPFVPLAAGVLIASCSYQSPGASQSNRLLSCPAPPAQTHGPP